MIKYGIPEEDLKEKEHIEDEETLPMPIWTTSKKRRETPKEGAAPKGVLFFRVPVKPVSD